jgi:hypothetical protein
VRWRRRVGYWLAIAACGLAPLVVACATTEEPPPDVAALARQHGVPQDDLALFLRGYERGYADGQSRSAGITAGTGFGNVPGPEGDGWQLGLRDALNGLPTRDPEELAAALREDRRRRGR